MKKQDRQKRNEHVVNAYKNKPADKTVNQLVDDLCNKYKVSTVTIYAIISDYNKNTLT